MSLPLAALDHVTKSFAGEAIVDDVSLAVAPGEIVALLGPSGCGKSTALRLVAGLEVTDAGRVEAPPKGFGLVFQDPTLMPWASALDNVALPLRFAKMPRAEARERARAALARVHLSDAADKRPRELSGGMRMRVAVARALVVEPKLLLMDEPFAALDEITRFRLADDLGELASETGLGVLFVTHSVFEAVSIADRILVMTPAPGRVAAEIAVVPDAPRGAAFRASPLFAATAARVSAALAAIATPATVDVAAPGG